ncbi:MAG: ABC transporter permease, partial [Rhizobiaceae bacterium]
MTTLSETSPQLAPAPSTLKVIRSIILGRPGTIVAVIIIAILCLVAILAPILAPYDPLKQSMTKINRFPSWENWLGTDQFGRDVLSRMIYGSRNSLIFGLISPVCAALIGTTLGVIAGYFGGITDRVISR